MRTVLGYEIEGDIVKAYDNIVIVENAEGVRHVVHKETLKPRFKRGRHTKSRLRFDLKASQATKKDPWNAHLRQSDWSI